MTEVVLEVRDGVATVTLNGPAVRNAMTLHSWGQLRSAIERCGGDESVRCVVVTGVGNAFCAGGDIREFVSDLAEPVRPDFETRVAGLRYIAHSVQLLHEMAKPTLAVIPGPAAGAGFCLALACDLRICVDTAKFTTAFARVGASGDFGGSWFLSRMVGTARARELYLRSEVFSAQKALDWGIVNRVVPADALAAEANALARELASGPTVAFGYMKKNLDAALTLPLADLLKLESEHMIRTLSTADHAEASQAFLQKRPPLFSGK